MARTRGLGSAGRGGRGLAVSRGEGARGAEDLRRARQALTHEHHAAVPPPSHAGGGDEGVHAKAADLAAN